MDSKVPSVLLVGSDVTWLEKCGEYLHKEVCEIDTVPTGLDALNMLHKRRYDVIAVDVSNSDIGAVEFALSVRDVAANDPPVLLVGEGLNHFERVWSHCNVPFAGPDDKMFGHIASAIRRLRSRAARRADSHLTGRRV